MPGIGEVRNNIRKAFTRFISWLLETTNFIDVGKNEAIVDALWVRLCTSGLYLYGLKPE